MKAPLWLKYGSVIKRHPKSKRKWNLELLCILFLFWIIAILQIVTVYSLCWHKDWLREEYVPGGPDTPKHLRIK